MSAADGLAWRKQGAKQIRIGSSFTGMREREGRSSAPHEYRVLGEDEEILEWMKYCCVGVVPTFDLCLYQDASP